MSPRLRTLALLVLAAASATLTPGPAVAKDPQPEGRPLLSLHYGDVLFHYFQGDVYGAMTRLMAARAMGRATQHEEDGDLLLAGLQLSFGQTRDALEGFDKLLKTEPRPAVRNRAWFALARALHLQGDDTGAQSALAHIDAALEDEPHPGPVTGDLEAERQMLAAEILIDAGRFDDAAALLDTWKGPADWSNFARYNLAVALIRSGRRSQGETVLDQIDRAGPDDEEQRALRDRANTELGYSHLQAKEWAAARAALRRVRLKGPSSNRALLGLGWAESELGRDREALVPWTELAGRDASDLAVQDALLAAPYATARLGFASNAAKRYDTAFDRYAKELQGLSAAEAAVGQPAFVDRLIEAGSQQLDPPVNDGRPVAAAARLPDAPEYALLGLLIASDRFQAGLQNARRLSFLRQHLADWGQRVKDIAPQTPRTDWVAPAERIVKLSKACDQSLARQAQALQKLALDDLQQRSQRLVQYQAEARYAQARTLDRSIERKPAAPGKPK